MSGPGLPTLAWRNLWRNRRRTAITLFSIAFGTLLAVLFTGIGDSSYSEMIDYAARLGGGHVVVQHPDYADHPSLKSTVRADAEVLDTIRDQDEVEGVVTRVSGGVLLSTSSNSVGAAVIALDPAQESEATFGLVDSISEGEFFQSRDDEGIILGSTLAENLDVELGKKVVFTVTDKSGEIREGLARVSGIIHTGATEVDAGTCLLPVGAVQELLGYEDDEYTQVAVFLDNHRSATEVATALGGELGEGYAALPWYEAAPDLAGFVTMKETGTLILELIITVLIAAGIFNTLFVSVMERIREFGILAAIGFSSLQLFALILWESLWLGLMGILAGVVLSAGPYWYLSTRGIDTAAMVQGSEGGGAQVAGVTMSQVLYVELYPPHAFVIAGAIVLATVAAGLYPAIKAGRVSPVEVIRIV